MQCTSPIKVKNPKTGNYMVVACGHCLHCRLQKTREWTVRLLNELNYWDDACFQTLTYRDDVRPTTPCGKSYLVKEDLQKFFKRLRKALDGRFIKYFACGEYGDESRHCHFHAIIFGVSVREMKKLIPDLWTFGEPFSCKTGTVTVDSINYVTGYVRKKLNGDSKFNSYFRCLPSAFQLQSRGLGLRFSEEYQDNIISNGLTIKGKPVSVPRYYTKKNEEVAAVIKKRSESSILGYWIKYFSRDPELSELEVRQKALYMSLKNDVRPVSESFDSMDQRSKSIKARYQLYNRQKI